MSDSNKTGSLPNCGINFILGSFHFELDIFIPGGGVVKLNRGSADLRGLRHTDLVDRMIGELGEMRGTVERLVSFYDREGFTK